MKRQNLLRGKRKLPVPKRIVRRHDTDFLLAISFPEDYPESRRK
jgi:hypothetical protein